MTGRGFNCYATMQQLGEEHSPGVEERVFKTKDNSHDDGWYLNHFHHGSGVADTGSEFRWTHTSTGSSVTWVVGRLLLVTLIVDTGFHHS
jgi:hypothetical protein